MNNMLLQCLIEIGKRFAKAKTLVQYGKWGEYCEKYTGYKQAMAENYIKFTRNTVQTNRAYLEILKILNQLRIWE